MTVLVTGGAGFIGRSVVRQLVADGERVVAITRDPDRAATVLGPEVDIRRGDLSLALTVADAMRGCDGVIHLAGDYRVGITPEERAAMFDSNVGTTTRVLDAAARAGLERVVVTSTGGVLGNTHGVIADERYRRDLSEGFLSYYDETKFLAHRVAAERITGGAPVIIAMPGTVYGPGDHSALGTQLEAAYRGTARYIVLGDVGVSPTHVDDAAAGIIAALRRGRIGESYILAGQNVRLRHGLAIAAEAGGHKLPRLSIPDAVIRIGAKAPASIAAAVGFPPNLPEVAAASLGVTYWLSSAKAATELGYRSRDLATGIRTLG